MYSGDSHAQQLFIVRHKQVHVVRGSCCKLDRIRPFDPCFHANSYIGFGSAAIKRNNFGILKDCITQFLC